MPDPQFPPLDPHVPERMPSLTAMWFFFLVVIVGIVAGSCIEAVDAVQAFTDLLPWHRHR